MATKKTPVKKQTFKKEVKHTLIVPEGTDVRVATKMDAILAAEKECLDYLAEIRALKAQHKAWLKAEGEKA